MQLKQKIGFTFAITLSLCCIHQFSAQADEPAGKAAESETKSAPAESEPKANTHADSESKAGTPTGGFAPQDDEKARKFRGELHAKKGSDMMKANNFRQAESEYKEAAKYEPDNIQYIEGYAHATNKANDYKEAIEAYGRLLKVDGAHHPEAHLVIAEALYKIRRLDEAVDAYKKALPFEKDKGVIWNKIAEIRLTQGRTPEVMEAYRGAIKAAPSDGKAYRLLAAMQWNAGSKADAVATYKNGAASAPHDGDLQAAYAYALMSNQQYEEAAKAYKAAAMLKGSTSELEAGYRSAMEHINYNDEMAKRAAAKKDKKKHKS